MLLINETIMKSLNERIALPRYNLLYRNVHFRSFFSSTFEPWQHLDCRNAAPWQDSIILPERLRFTRPANAARL